MSATEPRYCPISTLLSTFAVNHPGEFRDSGCCLASLGEGGILTVVGGLEFGWAACRCRPVQRWTSSLAGGLGWDGFPPTKSSQPVWRGAQRRSKSAARRVARCRRSPRYRCRAQIEDGRARRKAPIIPAGGRKSPNSAVRYLPFRTQMRDHAGDRPGQHERHDEGQEAQHEGQLPGHEHVAVPP